MKITRILSSAVLCLSLFACTSVNTELENPAILKDYTTKVVQLSDEFDEGSILVKFSQIPSAEALLELSSLGSVKPLFLSTKGNEALEAQFGLDKWYEVTLADGVSHSQAVKQAASMGSVSTVEYNNIATMDSDGVVYPLQESGTKASTCSFNDPNLNLQWHYNNGGGTSISPTAYAGADVNVYDVWSSLCCGDPSVIVAVVDYCIKTDHPDLAANMWTNDDEVPGNGIDDDNNGYIDDYYGYNFVRGSADVSLNASCSSHGTHCGGTIAAVNNNGVGVCGIAGGSGKNDGCRLMTCGVFSDGQGGTVTQACNAIKYAADNGASIISCSFGYTAAFQSDDAYIRSQGSAEIDAIHYFEAKKGNNKALSDGNIAIFAAGNESHNYAHYPGAYYDIISVSAFGPDFLPTYYTNYGPGCNISAPGGEAYHSTSNFKSMVLSTVHPEGENLGIDKTGYSTNLLYGYMQGTSMACPHVSGVVALAMSYAQKIGKSFTRDEFKQMILSSCNDIDQRINKVTKKTYAYYQSDLEMAPFYHQMGTGAIDAWRLCMKVEGTPTSTAIIGEKQWIDLTDSFGTASVSLTYLGVDVPQTTISSLGLQKMTYGSEECYAYIQYGRLYIYPTKVGSGKITISAIGGGDHLGGGSNPPGGFQIDNTISIIARDGGGGNGTGGWL